MDDFEFLGMQKFLGLKTEMRVQFRKGPSDSFPEIFLPSAYVGRQ